MTKKEHAKNRADWIAALADGRVLKHANGLTSYPTHEAMQAAIDVAELCGNDVEIVTSPAKYIGVVIDESSVLR